MTTKKKGLSPDTKQRLLELAGMHPRRFRYEEEEDDYNDRDYERGNDYDQSERGDDNDDDYNNDVSDYDEEDRDEGMGDESRDAVETLLRTIDEYEREELLDIVDRLASALPEEDLQDVLAGMEERDEGPDEYEGGYGDEGGGYEDEMGGDEGTSMAYKRDMGEEPSGDYDEQGMSGPEEEEMNADNCPHCKTMRMNRIRRLGGV